MDRPLLVRAGRADGARALPDLSLMLLAAISAVNQLLVMGAFWYGAGGSPRCWRTRPRSSWSTTTVPRSSHASCGGSPERWAAAARPSGSWVGRRRGRPSGRRKIRPRDGQRKIRPRDGRRTRRPGTADGTRRSGDAQLPEVAEDCSEEEGSFSAAMKLRMMLPGALGREGGQQRGREAEGSSARVGGVGDEGTSAGAKGAAAGRARGAAGAGGACGAADQPVDGGDVPLDDHVAGVLNACLFYRSRRRTPLVFIGALLTLLRYLDIRRGRPQRCSTHRTPRRRPHPDRRCRLTNHAAEPHATTNPLGPPAPSQRPIVRTAEAARGVLQVHGVDRGRLGSAERGASARAPREPHGQHARGKRRSQRIPGTAPGGALDGCEGQLA